MAAAGAVLAAIAMAGWSPAAASAAACPNAAHRTGPSADLPDCRAYELVSPADKDAYTLVQSTSAGSIAYPAAGGDAAAFAAATPFADAAAGTLGIYASTRGPDGWTTRNVVPAFCGPDPSGLFAGVGLAGFSDDFSTAILNDPNYDNCAPGDHAGQDLYTTDADGTLTWVSQNGQPKTVDAQATLVGSSADASHIVFTTPEKLVLPLEAAREPGKGLYDRTGGRTLAVAVKDDGGLINDCAPKPASDYSDLVRSVSADGRVIFFRSGSSTTVPGCSPTTDDGGQLYARIDHRHTVLISPSLLAAPEARQLPRFMGATQDGRRAFFVSTERLTTDATTGGGLYEYDLTAVLDGTAATGTLTFLSPSIDGASAQVSGSTLGGARGLVGLSDDGSRVYFVASGKLDLAAPAGTNLYVTQGGAVTYVAPWSGDGFKPMVGASVSADGTKVVFPARPSGGSTMQLYLAAPGTGAAPICVSCPSSGTPSDDAVLIGAGDGRPPVLGGARNVTDDGRVFFNSPDQLDPHDTNATYDVYEYRDGDQLLLSSGTSAYDSLLVGTGGPDGRDVFFVTNESLVGQDFDNGDQDLYDARTGGGFPPPPAAPSPCVGDACQGPARAAPTTAMAATVSFAGAGNVHGDRARGGSARVAVRGRRAVRGTSAWLTVRVGERGRIAVSGPRVRRASRAAAKAGSYRLRVRLTRAARLRLARRHRAAVRERQALRALGALTRRAQVRIARHERLGVRVRVRFAPAGGQARSTVARLTFRPARAGAARRAVRAAVRAQRAHTAAAKGGR